MRWYLNGLLPESQRLSKRTQRSGKLYLKRLENFLNFSHRKPYPLTTVDLQKSGSRLLHMSAKQILDVRCPVSSTSSHSCRTNRQQTRYTSEGSCPIQEQKPISLTTNSILDRSYKSKPRIPDGVRLRPACEQESLANHAKGRRTTRRTPLFTQRHMLETWQGTKRKCTSMSLVDSWLAVRRTLRAFKRLSL